MGATTNHPLALYAGTVERVRISSDGQLGINKSSPKAWHTDYRSLQIHDAGYIAGSTDDSFVAIGANNYLDTGGSYDYTNSDFASQLYQVDGTLVFRNAASGTADNAITWLERLKIDSDGTLKMDQAGTNTNVLANDTGGPNIWLKNTSDTNGNYSKIGFFNSTGYITAFMAAQYQDAGDRNTDLVFGTRANGGALAERLRINSGGQVLIGTATAPAYSNRRFTVYDSTNSGTCALALRGSSSGTSRLYFTSSTTSGQTGAYAGKVLYDHASNFMTFHTNGSNERVRIDSAGRMGIAQTPAVSNLEISHTGTNSPVNQIELNTPNVSDGGGSGIFFKNSGATGSSHTNRYGTRLHTIRGNNGCLLYTSPSPRDRG